MREDAWLSQVLERPVYTVETGDGSFERQGFYSAKVPVEDVGRVHELTAAGFAVVDVNVTLAADPASRPEARDGVEVVPARPEHADALLDVAGSCFRYSRFHLDPAFPRELADRVKREWVCSYVEGRRGTELLAGLVEGEPVGFLAVLEADGVRVIDLVGVGTATQGRGVGRSLVAAFAQRHGPHARELRVGTQVANVPSLRLYQACGFAIASSSYVLHLHVRA